MTKQTSTRTRRGLRAAKSRNTSLAKPDRPQRTKPRSGRLSPVRRGIVLVIVLVVVVMLSLSAYTFSDLMLTHHESVTLNGRQLQASALADSGTAMVRLYLSNDEATQEEMGGHFNNPGMFQGINVVDDPDPRLRGNFTILAPNLDVEGNLVGVRYGLEDESTRLNLNTLLLADEFQENGGRTLLMALPGMNEYAADAILDWLDEDDEPREFGAEGDYYSGLNPPYAAKNGPLDSVEELLLVKDVTPQMLFGFDINRNGVVDQHELQGPFGAAPTGMGANTGGTTNLAGGASGATGQLDPSQDPALQLGWSAYLTLFSKESNLDKEGLPRIYVNQEDMQALYDELKEVFSEDWATFIVAYRQYGPMTDQGEGGEGGEAGEGGGEGGEAGGGQPGGGGGGGGRGGGCQDEGIQDEGMSESGLDLTRPGQIPLIQALDLIGARVQLPAQEGMEAVVLNSPFSEDIGAMNVYLPILLDKITVTEAETVPGRINVNEASRTVMKGIPGLSEEMLDQILEARSSQTTDDQGDTRDNETWLMTSGIVTLEDMRALYPFVCAGGDVHRAQVVGYFEDGEAAARHEVVFDATAVVPRVLSWRDVSHLGRGFALDTLGAQIVDVR